MDEEGESELCNCDMRDCQHAYHSTVLKKPQVIAFYAGGWISKELAVEIIALHCVYCGDYKQPENVSPIAKKGDSDGNFNREA